MLVKINKAFKYRLCPTEDQRILLAQHFGAKRFIFNHFLEERKNAYQEAKKSLNYFDNSASLTQMKKLPEYVWLKQVNSQAIQASLRDLDVAYNRFFHKTSAFPRFKSRRDKQSFKVPQSVSLDEQGLWIPKFKQAIRVKVHRPLQGEILYATVSRNQNGDYYVSITVEYEHQPLPKTDKTVGFDLGLKDLVVCSDGTRFPALKQNKKYQKQLAYRQQQLARKTKGSNRSNKQRVKVARLYQRMSDTRNNYLHNISSKLVNENQVICFESLAVRNMVKNHCLAGAISDVAWGELTRQVKYKSDWNGRSAVQVDRFYPSSKTCFGCGYIHQDLKLSDREWNCPNCKRLNDRDHNASLNIEQEGLRCLAEQNLSGVAIISDIKQKGREASGCKTESMNCWQAPRSLAEG